MKFITLVFLSTAASALYIQPRQFDGCSSGPADAENDVIPGGNFPQNDANNGANDGANNGANNGANQGAGNGGNNGNNNGQENGDGQGNDNGQGAGDATGGGDAAVDGQTVVFTEINGVPGNECLTFRNNGEIVDAACVNTAADRQLTPTTINGQNTLLVQRTFTAGFRPDLVDVQACVGFNGTHFRAEGCDAQGIEPVTFQNGQLVASGGACASGHDDLAQMTVDASGAQCATYSTTDVQPATS